MNEFRQVIKIVRGNEQNVRITGDIREPEDFMYPSYQQAMRALLEIVRQTDSFHQQARNADEDELADALFCYNGNTIVFEGERGRGKTQMMMSFTRILRNYTKDRKWEKKDGGNPIEFLGEEGQKSLADVRFHVFPPISPSVLEDNQNILFLILSRLYDYASSLLGHSRKTDENDRNKLIKLFSACLSGIDGIKRGKAFQQSNDDKLELADLQDISDGAALRSKFYDLVQELNRIEDSGKEKSFLVIQIDDADSQIKNGYKAIEDIRKYLVIPNVIIVMSADINFLHKVIIQEQGHFFSKLCDKDDSLCAELVQMSRKYIDKLIPPSHMVHLPKLEQTIENSPDSLIFRYIYDDTGKPVFEWMDNGDVWDVQNMLFMLIYRKTGIVFVRPAAYLHNIVPRSIRGLNQLLYFLSQMDDIPQLRKEDWQDSPTLAQKIQKQLRVAMPNLDAFERYFSNTWVEVKIRHDGDKKFIHELIRSAGFNHVRLALRYLKGRYNVDHEINDQRIALEKMIKDLEKDHREQEDFLLFFTIHTVLTIASHKKVLHRKRETVEDYLEKWQEIVENEKRNSKEADASHAPLLVFDYDPDITTLPKTYMKPRNFPNVLLYTGKKEDSNNEFLRSDTRKAIYEMCEDDKENLDALLNSPKEMDYKPHKFLEDCMICVNEEGEETVNFMNLITYMLRIGCKNPVIVGSEYSNSPNTDWHAKQDSLYRMQEIALFIASNWDVQGYLYKYLAHEINMIRDGVDDAPSLHIERTSDNVTCTPGKLYEAIDNTLNGINSSSFRDYVLSRYSRIPQNSKDTMLVKAYVALQTPDTFKRKIGDSLVLGLDFTKIFVRKLVGAETVDVPQKSETNDASNEKNQTGLSNIDLAKEQAKEDRQASEGGRNNTGRE